MGHGRGSGTGNAEEGRCEDKGSATAPEAACRDGAAAAAEHQRAGLLPDRARGSQGKSQVTRRMDCPRFDGCSAPICPISEDSMRNCAWFPDEDICPLRDVPSWVRRQRRIATAAGKDRDRGCFTAAMLSHPCVIGSAIKGLDPESEITARRAQEWISARPATRQLTAEQRAAATARLVSERPIRRARTSSAKAGSRSPVADPTADGKSSTLEPDTPPVAVQTVHRLSVSAKGYTA